MEKSTNEYSLYFDQVIIFIFQTLVYISEDFLNNSKDGTKLDESEIEFCVHICYSVVGFSNFKCIANDDATLILYLQLVILNLY